MLIYPNPRPPPFTLLSSLGGIQHEPADGLTVVGGANLLRAFFRDDIPEDPQQIFLTSWGEWWPKDVYGLALDEKLQDKWSPSKEEIEKEEGVAA